MCGPHSGWQWTRGPILLLCFWLRRRPPPRLPRLLLCTGELCCRTGSECQCCDFSQKKNTKKCVIFLICGFPAWLHSVDAYRTQRQVKKPTAQTVTPVQKQVPLQPQPQPSVNAKAKITVCYSVHPQYSRSALISWCLSFIHINNECMRHCSNAVTVYVFRAVCSLHCVSVCVPRLLMKKQGSCRL